MISVRAAASASVCVVLIAGCTSGEKTRIANQVTGKWYGKTRPVKGAEPDPALQKFVDIAAVSPLTLELTPEGTFTLTMMSAPMTGFYTVVSDKVTLKIESVSGQRIDDPKSPLAFMLEELKEPMVGTLRDGGKTLFFAAKTKEPGDADMTFTRNPPAEDKVGGKTVSTSEAKLVGKYVFDTTYAPPSKPPADPNDKREIARRKAQEFVRRQAKSSRLSLRADNSFVMEIMVTLKGTWKLRGNELVMTMREPKAMVDYAAKGGNKPEMKARLSKDPSQLLMLNDKSREVDFALRRE
ncbi:MAG: hypothetical protein ACR2HJ_05585 [Fimbriimonadales bacterium]